MLNKISLLSFIVLTGFICTTAYAQVIEGNDAQENLDKIGSITTEIGLVRKFDNRYEGVKGSPFYIDEWLPGTLVLKNGRSVDDVKIKYNMYEDELLLLDPKSGALYVDRDSISSFTIENASNTEKFVISRHPKKDVSQYYRVVHPGDPMLLEHTNVVYEKADYQGGYSNQKTFDEFKKYEAFYALSKNDAVPQKIKSGANAVSKLFGEKQPMVKKYINMEMLDCRKLPDLVKVFRYAETIN